jgi:hypothetical protein
MTARRSCCSSNSRRGRLLIWSATITASTAASAVISVNWNSFIDPRRHKTPTSSHACGPGLRSREDEQRAGKRMSSMRDHAQPRLGRFTLELARSEEVLVSEHAARRTGRV